MLRDLEQLALLEAPGEQVGGNRNQSRKCVFADEDSIFSDEVENPKK